MKKDIAYKIEVLNKTRKQWAWVARTGNHKYNYPFRGEAPRSTCYCCEDVMQRFRTMKCNSCLLTGFAWLKTTMGYCNCQADGDSIYWSYRRSGNEYERRATAKQMVEACKMAIAKLQKKGR